jgi:hypothetical protein
MVEGEAVKPKTILNLGCADTHLENVAEGWQEVRADIDPRYDPDIIVDVRDLSSLEHKSFDAIYCSHVIEHVYAFEVLPMLRNFHRIAREYVQIRCPDIGMIAKTIAAGIAPDQPLYRAPAGIVTALDLIYGYAPHIKNTSEFYAHKTGFTNAILGRLLTMVGFGYVRVFEHPNEWELEAIAEFHKPIEIAQSIPDNVRRLN